MILGLSAINVWAAGQIDRSDVSSFNDGWATSKQDDCEQGFQQACAWLRENK